MNKLNLALVSAIICISIVGLAQVPRLGIGSNRSRQIQQHGAVAVRARLALSGGSKGGGGGDPCRDEIAKNRIQIRDWILRDDANKLDFTKALVQPMSYDVYKARMLSVLQDENAVIVTCFLDPGTSNAGNSQDTVNNYGVSYKSITIDGQPTTCINYEDNSGQSHIDCNYDLIMNANALGDPDYRTTHHEYASIAGVEKRKINSSPDYSISDQLSRFEHKELITVLGAVLDVPISSDSVDISSLVNTVFSATNCATCEVEFSSVDGKIVAKMVNWGGYGVTYSENIPVSYDIKRKQLSIFDGSCIYWLKKDYNGSINEIGLIHRDTVCPGSMVKKVVVPVELARLYRDLQNNIWKAANCDTCEVEFSTVDGKIVAKMVNWGNYGVTYTANIPISYESKRNQLSFFGGSDCIYNVESDQNGNIVRLGVINRENNCPETMTKSEY